MLFSCQHLNLIEQIDVIAVMERVQTGHTSYLCVFLPRLSLGISVLPLLSPLECTAKISFENRWISLFLFVDTLHSGPLISDLSIKGSRRGGARGK